MKQYDFNHIIDRSNSDSSKYCNRHLMFGNEDILPLWIADMDFKVCPEITEALARRVSHPIYGYPGVHPGFFSSITDWLASRHGLEVKPEEITFIPGVVKGIGYAINRFSEPGDKIIIQPPVYHPFRAVIEGNGRVVVNNPLVFDGRFYDMDLELLERQLAAEKPAMLILCNPHNPIGITWKPETLRRVADLCLAHDVTVVSDEIHGDLALKGHYHTPYLSVSDAARKTGVMLGAPSKTFNIPGLVSSWCVVKDADKRRRLFDWLTVNDFNSPTFFAMTATESAYRHGRQWLLEVMDYIAGNIDYICCAVPEMSDGRLKCIAPQASFLVWVDCRNLNLDSQRLDDFFVNKARLGLNNGRMFGEEGEGFMRLNVASPRQTLEKAMIQLKKALDELK